MSRDEIVHIANIGGLNALSALRDTLGRITPEPHEQPLDILRRAIRETLQSEDY